MSTESDELRTIAGDLEDRAGRLRALAGAAPPPPPPKVVGVWTSREELASLSTVGKAWEAVATWAARPVGAPNVSNQEDDQSTVALAKALVVARSGQSSSRDALLREVGQLCELAVGTEKGARALALGREVIGYVAAADLAGYSSARFSGWVDAVRRAPTVGGPASMVACHEERPNNWGTHCGASRAACSAYLRDEADLTKCSVIFRGWLGDRAAYAGFAYGDPDWQADRTRPVGVNARGSTIQNHSVDGVLPDDQRRSGPFAWPPPKQNYVWEALQGAFAQALVLQRAGYSGVWEWSDQALLRAVQWLHSQAQYPAGGDDTWIPYLANWAYGSSFPAPVPSQPGKNVGFTDWTHQGRRA